MKSLGHYLKRKRDAEERLQRNSNNLYHYKSNDTLVVSDESDVTPTSDQEKGTIVNTANDLSEHISAPDPHPQYLTASEGARIYREEFLGLLEWTVQHNFSSDPSVTVWERVGAAGYGVQAFGTTPFGGTLETSIKVSYPEILKIDENTIKIVWASNTYGKVVCIG